MNLRRVAAGEWETGDGRYRIVCAWGGSSGWTILRMAPSGFVEVLDTVPRLRDARAWLDGQLDTVSSASRQYYIDTGRYLWRGDAS